MSNHVILTADGVQLGPTLSLERTPVFLRFVLKGDDWKTLDALDQLDDVPADDERVVVAKVVAHGGVHIDRVVKGRRVGEWHGTAKYAVLYQQPPQDVLRDTAKWTEWVTGEWEKSKEAGE